MPKIAIVLTNGYADLECAFLNGIGSAYYGVDAFLSMLAREHAM